MRSVLESFGFAQIKRHAKELRCGRTRDANPNAISIRLENNPNLFAHDFARDYSFDLFTFIIKEKNVSFQDVIRAVKAELEISGTAFSPAKQVFGGFYKQPRKTREDVPIKLYGTDVLSGCLPASFQRFTNDHISLEAQRFFNLRYDPESQRIAIPIYDGAGNLMGMKGRANWDVAQDEQKYLYLIPCRAGQTLYGYAQNYAYLTDNIVYVTEAEKSVMQAYSYGMRNFVALGSNSLSSAQCKMLIELRPEKIILLLDKGLDMQVIDGNLKRLRTFMRFSDAAIGFWDYRLNKILPDKASPTDFGRKALQNILRKEIVYV